MVDGKTAVAYLRNCVDGGIHHKMDRVLLLYCELTNQHVHAYSRLPTGELEAHQWKLTQFLLLAGTFMWLQLSLN